MPKVAILTYNHASFFELGCAVELFALERPEFNDWYQTDIVSFNDGLNNLTGGVQMTSKHIKNFNNYDLLVIPSWSDSNDEDRTLNDEIIKFYKQGKRIISFCSGAFLLAKLGILNQRQAITHWRYADQFKHQFPHIHYSDDVLYSYDGTIGCSAGSSAAIDLGLEVIRQDFGYEAANSVARRLVLSAHRKGGQSQFSEVVVKNKSNQFNNAIEWALSNLTNTIHINQLAQKANMSRRSFDRKFKANLNLTPKEWLTHQRLHLAKSLLEQHEYSVERIAELSGFDNASTMRHHFRKEFGVSPSFHRSQFFNRVLPSNIH